MAANIKTLVDGGGNQVLPRTWAKAVLTGDGGTVEAKFAEITGELGGISSAVGKARPNIIGTYPVAEGETIAAGDVVDVKAEGTVGKTIVEHANQKTVIGGKSFGMGIAALNSEQLIEIEWARSSDNLYSASVRLLLCKNHSVVGSSSATMRTADYGVIGHVTVCRLSDTQFVAGCVIQDIFYVQIGTVGGESISLGTRYQLSAATTDYNALIPLSETSFLAVYNRAGLKARVGSVSGTNITFANEVSLPGNTSSAYISATLLPDDANGNKRVCVCFVDAGDGNKGKAVIATISGANVATWGAPVIYYDLALNLHFTSCCVDGDDIVVSAQNGSAQVFCSVLNVSGSVITVNSALQVNGYSSSSAQVLKSGNSIVLLGTADSGCRAARLLKDKKALSISDDIFIFNNTSADLLSSALISGNMFILVYADRGNSNYATATILEVFGDQIAGSFTDESSQCIALQSGEAGQEIEVIFDGVAELPGAAAGREITSPGVYGYCPRDGWLWVRPEWESAVCGSYTGVGSTLNREIELGFTPSAVIVCCERQNNDYVGNFPVGVVHKGRAVYYSTIKVLEITDGGFVVGSSGTGSGSAFNTEGLIYNYIALR